MKTCRYEVLLEAAQPIAHHSETMGNHAVIARKKVRQADGAFADVPYISGDAMRHGIREAAAYAFLDAAGLLDDGALSENTLRLLFAGGAMSGRGDGSTVNFDEYRQLCELVPPLGLMGGCVSNRVIPGRLFCEEATLVCEETRRSVPEWAADHVGQIASQRQHVEEVQRVRMDPTLDPGKQKLLSASAQNDLNKRLASSEVAHDTDNAIERSASKSTMLPRTFERLCQGSLFNWTVTAHTYSDLDVDTFHVALGVFLSRPHVGGKRGTGHGELRVVQARDISVSRPSEKAEVLEVTALGGRVGSLFRAHVTERRDRIREFLSTVTA